MHWGVVSLMEIDSVLIFWSNIKVIFDVIGISVALFCGVIDETVNGESVTVSSDSDCVHPSVEIRDSRSRPFLLIAIVYIRVLK
jgi:hypothetical protein